MAAAAADPNLQLTNQLLGNPVLQYQLLMHSLLLPLLARTAPSGGTSPEGGAAAAAADEVGEEEVHLRMTVLANQLAITQLNQLVMGLIDDEANSKDNRGETATHPEQEEEEEEERWRTQQHEALEYQKKLLQLLTEGFTAVHAEMTDAKALLSSVLDAAVAGQNSTEALQLRALAAASEGFANTSFDVTRLRDDLHDLTSSHVDQLEDSTEAVLWKVAALMSESFAEVSAHVGSLRREVHGLNATYVRHSQEAMELTQVTATGLLRLQVDVNNLTATLEEALATFTNATSGVGGEEKKGANCSVAAGEAWRCPDGFFLVGKECFHASEDRVQLSWAQARESCKGLGGDLAVPEEVLLLILAVRKRLGEGLEGMWVGGGEQESEDSFHSSRSDTGPSYDLFDPAPWGWVSGEAVTHGWLHGRPLGPAGVKTCLTLSDLGLDSAFCESPRRFLCQRDALGDAGGHD